MTEYYRLNVNQLWKIQDQNNLRKLQAKDNYITTQQMFQYETANPTGQVMPVSSGVLDGGIINQWDGDVMRLEYVIERENVNYEASELNGTTDLEPVNFETIPLQIKTDIFKTMNVLYRECQKLFSSPQVGEGDILNIFKFYNDFANLYDTYLMDIKQDPIFKNNFNARVVELESIFQKIKTRIQAWGDKQQFTNNIFTTANSYPEEYLEARIRDIIYSLNEMLKLQNIGYFIKDTMQYSQITAQPAPTLPIPKEEVEGDDDEERRGAEAALSAVGTARPSNIKSLGDAMREEGEADEGSVADGVLPSSVADLLSPRKGVDNYLSFASLERQYRNAIKEQNYKKAGQVLDELSTGGFKLSQLEKLITYTDNEFEGLDLRDLKTLYFQNMAEYLSSGNRENLEIANDKLTQLNDIIGSTNVKYLKLITRNRLEALIPPGEETALFGSEGAEETKEVEPVALPPALPATPVKPIRSIDDLITPDTPKNTKRLKARFQNFIRQYITNKTKSDMESADETLKKLQENLGMTDEEASAFKEDEMKKYVVKAEEPKVEEAKVEEAKVDDTSLRLQYFKNEEGQFVFLNKAELKVKLENLATIYRKYIVANNNKINTNIPFKEFADFIRTIIKPYLTETQQYRKLNLTSPMNKINNTQLKILLEPNLSIDNKAKQKFNGEFYKYLVDLGKGQINVFTPKINSILSKNNYNGVSKELYSSFATKANNWLVV